jgi:hypothetical protein
MTPEDRLLCSNCGADCGEQSNSAEFCRFYEHGDLCDACRDKLQKGPLPSCKECGQPISGKCGECEDREFDAAMEEVHKRNVVTRTVSVGWVCPVCHKANAPDVKQCPTCGASSDAADTGQVQPRTVFPLVCPSCGAKITDIHVVHAEQPKVFRVEVIDTPIGPAGDDLSSPPMWSTPEAQEGGEG